MVVWRLWHKVIRSRVDWFSFIAYICMLSLILNNMKTNKNLFIILLSTSSLIGGIWAVMSIIKERKETSVQIDSPQIKIDPSKIDITIEGNDMTKKYPGSANAKSPGQVVISIDSKQGQIYFNDSKVLFGTSSDSIFELIGNPDRFKTIVSNSSTYIFDRFGFYIRTDSNNSFSALSIYFKAGKLDISPKSIFSSKIIVDGIEISEKSVAEDLFMKLKLDKHPLAKDNYIKEASTLKLVLNFNSPDEELVNLFVETK